MTRAAIVTALALAQLYVLYLAGWLIYQRYGSQQPRTLSPRDGGLPHNIIPPRSRFHVQHTRAPAGLYFYVDRRTRADADAHTHNAYVIKWRAWQIDVVAFTHHFHLSRWCERWGS